MAAFLYLIDGLELMLKLYDSFLKEFKTNYNLSFTKNIFPQKSLVIRNKVFTVIELVERYIYLHIRE